MQVSAHVHVNTVTGSCTGKHAHICVARGGARGLGGQLLIVVPADCNGSGPSDSWRGGD